MAEGKRRKNKKPRFPGEDATSRELEAFVFGTAPAAESKSGLSTGVSGGKTETAPKEEKAGKRKKSEGAGGGLGKAARANAWTDPDDATFNVDLTARKRLTKFRRSMKETQVTGPEYEKRLRAHFTKLHGSVGWADEPEEAADSSEDSDDEQQVPTSARTVAKTPGGRLKAKEVQIARVKDVRIAGGGAAKGPCAIQALQFHPNSELLLTGGYDKKLRLFNVDGDENPKVASYYFERFPIYGASFTPSGDQVLITSKSPKMWGLDVRTGESFPVIPVTAQLHRRYHSLTVGPNPADQPGLHSSHMYSVMGDAGNVLICDVPTRHVVRTLRMSAPGVAACFSHERDALFTADAECNLYEWDLGTGRCRQKTKDPWATKIKTLALSRATKNSPAPLLAVGTGTGNLDLFDVSGPAMPKEPTHSIGNLTTAVTGLRFHHEGELLVACSRRKRDAMKLVHATTATVFENWPSERTPLERVSAIDMSRRGGFMAIGNERGKVLLYQLAHYAKAASES